MNRILGISSMFHDAAVCVIEDGEILFASHAERYSKEKNDPFLNEQLMTEALSYGLPDVIVLHEKTWAKRLRNIAGRQWSGLREPSAESFIKTSMPFLNDVPIKSYWHHETHAAAGVLTSNLDSAAVMVIDAIGEFDTASIWHWKDNKLTKKHSIKFPHSLGLFYSAVTHFVGLKPMEDEYILMGMAAYGNDVVAADIESAMTDVYFNNKQGPIKFRENLQRGLPHKSHFNQYDNMDIALAAQNITEKHILDYANIAKNITGENNLVFMGGVALNCVANSRLCSLFENVHIMPNPGDAGSALGAAALEYFNQTGNKVNWKSPYLGTNIPGKYPVNKAMGALTSNKIFGIANGRAEFGPRALGNRSLMADPRGEQIKQRVNVIKKRQQFRPFAPVVLEQYANKYFDMPVASSPYMQFVAKCKFPNMYPAIVHADGSSRVQTVNKSQHPGLYQLLMEFYSSTGCPMLLNTSLNIKGQPIINDEDDAKAWTLQYGRPVFTHD